MAISDDFLGDFPRVLATWYHFPGNFHRYVLSFRLGVPIPDPFLEDAAMASPKRRAGAVFGVGNTSQAYQPYTHIVALEKLYNMPCYEHVLTRKTGAHRSHSAMVSHSKRGARLCFITAEKWYQVARTLGKSPKKSSEIANTTPYLKVRRGVGDF